MSVVVVREGWTQSCRMTDSTRSSWSPALVEATRSFAPRTGYLAACTMGLPMTATLDAQRLDLDTWRTGGTSPIEYGAVVEEARVAYAALVAVPVARVAIGSQTSSMVAVVAAAVPDGAEVLCVDGDFSSMVFPFLQQRHRGVRVRSVPLGELAEAVSDDTWLVAWSAIQSATGAVADDAAIVAAARRHDALTLCDTTQAAGVLPVDAGRYDVTVCHAYKWLCSPRGAAFLTVSAEAAPRLRPVQAGWYAGESVWGSCYGPTMELAHDARAFDVSPAWPVWVGALPALRTFATLDMTEIWTRASGLGDLLCERLGIAPQGQAIVTWVDPGDDLAALTAAGLTASGRAGRVRIAFHLWNDEDDVEAVARALRG
jgi:selenocysteine lyase/cysteine desulfurase